MYGIVKQSGGYIWVDSEPGNGTAFKIYLPRVEGSGKVAAPAEVRAPMPTGSETILLVEDDAALRAAVRRILVADGYSVLEAGNGDEALVICASHTGSMQLVLTDMVMPKMNGQELASRLRALRPGMPVLFMSGYTEDAVLRRSLLEEGAAFVNKPFTPDSLRAKVRALLGVSAQR